MSNLLKRILFAIPLIFIILFFINNGLFYLLALFSFLYILFFEWPKLFKISDPKFYLFIPYLLLPLSLISYIAALNKDLIIFFIIVVALNDTGAYLFGKKYGKNKIAPQISPGKSWEGFFGGLLITFITIAFFFRHSNYSIIFIFLFSLLISVTATLGDLFESYLKRRVGIKDSGKLLGPHGGLLDRIDSYLFVIFVIYIFKSVILIN